MNREMNNLTIRILGLLCVVDEISNCRLATDANVLVRIVVSESEAQKRSINGHG